MKFQWFWAAALVSIGMVGEVRAESGGQKIRLQSSLTGGGLSLGGPMGPCPFEVDEDGTLNCTFTVFVDPPPSPAVDVCIGFAGTLPPGFSVLTANPVCGSNEATIEFEVAPGFCDAGDYQLELYYTIDGSQTDAPQTLTVDDTPRAPTFEVTSASTFDAGSVVTLEFIHHDLDATECGEPLGTVALPSGTPGTLTDNLDGTLTYEWDTSGVDPGTYVIGLIIEALFGDTFEVPIELQLAVPPKIEVLVTVKLYDVKFDDDMDVFGNGEMYWMSWARFAGEPAAKAMTTGTKTATSVESGMTYGVNAIILEREMCCQLPGCPIPNLEVTTFFWDDDNNTVGKMGKILKELSAATTVADPAVGLSALAIGAILEAAGEPSHDELGTLREVPGAPFLPPAGCEYLLTLMPTQPAPPAAPVYYPLNLNHGAGAQNGGVNLGWTSTKKGLCTELPDPIGDSSFGPGSHDLTRATLSQCSARELRLSYQTSGTESSPGLADGDTRTIQFGLDTDLDRSTGAFFGSMQGTEWRVELRQEGVAGETVTTVAIDEWDGFSFQPTGAPALHVDTYVHQGELVIDPLAIGSPAQLALVTALKRNGSEVDSSPNDLDLIHYITWLPDDAPPGVSTSVAWPSEINGDLEEIVLVLTEPTTIAPSDVTIDPPVDIVIALDYRTLTITPVTEFPPGDYTLTIAASAQDLEGNPFDGDRDGVGGDAFVLPFFVADYSVIPTDATGQFQNEFLEDEDIYVTAEGLTPFGEVIVYLTPVDIGDGEVLVDQAGGPTLQVALGDGTIPPFTIGTASSPGEYALVIDNDGDGIFGVGVDHWWHPHGIGVNVTAGSVAPLFRRGDSNNDGGVDISDGIYSLSALFVSGSSLPACQDAGDANDDGLFDVGDVIFTLTAIFVPGSPPPPPPGTTTCGVDPTPDSFDCLFHPNCP